ncbi:DNA-binding protein [Aureibacillus halotolerans]|uniref:DNA-binding protein n=1 Tax=Aureibacillus halotolerans TaxID=1508390 RepID=A0A4R6U8N3_9BACI|nr:DNA-binding protein [Aureibacillus halotolerans]TDQ42761.1 hypothetical protein EV213_101190 [Aureibacillus halotolerans]
MKKTSWSIAVRGWILALATVLLVVQPGHAEGPLDPAPVLEPVQPNGKTVLVDNSHGQTAGASDWVIDGAFSDFAEALAEEGYLVREHRSEDDLTIADLQGIDVFVIPEPQIPFTAEEQASILSFTEAGGGVFFIADHYNADRNLNRWDSGEIFNGWRRGAWEDPFKGMNTAEKKALEGVTNSEWLSDNFGIQFRYNGINNTVANHIVAPSDTFGITEGVEKVAIHAGATLAITDPTIAKGIVYLPTGLTSEANSWGPAVDQGVYFGGGIDEGPFAAISKVENGKAAFIGDSSPVEDATPKYRNEEHGGTKRTYDGFLEHDDATLLINMMNWLAEEECYKTFAQKNIPLDDVSPLLDMELPEQSTEPQTEPWRSPDAGYLWYDRSTFAPGSYGAEDGEVPVDASYAISLEEPVPVGNKPFDVTVQVTNAAPGSTVSNLEIQLYLSGGRQISQVQQADGSWSRTGYASIAPVSIGNDGTGKITFSMRLTDVSATQGNIRLRQQGENLLTQSVTLAP